MNLLQASNHSIAKVLVVPMDENCSNFALKTAKQLRDSGINTDLYSNFQKDMKAKLKYADKQNIPYVCIIGENEIQENVVTLKNMQQKTQEKQTVEELIKILK